MKKLLIAAALIAAALTAGCKDTTKALTPDQAAAERDHIMALYHANRLGQTETHYALSAISDGLVKYYDTRR